MSTLNLWWVRTFEERFNRLHRTTPSAEKQALLMLEMSTSPVSTAVFAALRRAFVVFPMALTTTIGLSASAWRCRQSCFNLSTGAPLLNSTLLVQLAPFEQFQHIGGVALLLQLKCHQTSSPASTAGRSLPELKLLEASSRSSRASFSVREEDQKRHPTTECCFV